MTIGNPRTPGIFVGVDSSRAFRAAPVIAGPVVAPVVPTVDLVAHWKGFENTDDSSGNGNNAVWFGAPQYDDGYGFKVLQSTADNTAVAAPKNEQMALVDTSTFTLQFRFAAFSASPIFIIGDVTAGSTVTQMILGIAPDGKLCFSTLSNTYTFGVLSTGTAHGLIVTYDDGEWHFYLDQTEIFAEEGAITAEVLLPAASDVGRLYFFAGDSGYPDYTPLQLNVYDVQVFNGLIPPPELTADFEPPPPTVGFYGDVVQTSIASLGALGGRLWQATFHAELDGDVIIGSSAENVSGDVTDIDFWISGLDHPGTLVMTLKVGTVLASDRNTFDNVIYSEKTKTVIVT